MAKKTHPIAEAILRVIAESGGTLAAADLSDKLPDIADANRRYHVSRLVAEGRLTSIGKTSDRVYAVTEPGAAPPQGHRISNATKAKPKKARARTAAEPPPIEEPFDQFAHAEREAEAAVAANGQLVPRQRPSLNIAVAIVRPTLEDQNTVSVDPTFLRRVLCLALGAPGDISDADRQALHAVALAS